MKFKRVFLIAVILSVFASPVLAERWTVSEGVAGEWSGSWLIENGRADFPCSQRYGGNVLTANCVVIRQGSRVAVSKRDVSDGNPCNYFGDVSGKSISGQYFCKNGGPYNWSAVISE